MHNLTKVTGPELAECPDEGGKWIIYCEHFDSDGEVENVGICQDTNKRRLAAWKREPLMWCCACQEAHEEEVA